ncbi:helix-turn-helix transcriptional regulator [Paraburkholderia sediminicola]|uniref:hypothetical protein n=1 Tax=Paraburkholderia sediminicola TaxID=458836 RepID=UPI0038BA0438
MKGKPKLKELMEATQLSRATIDRALNDRPGMHPRTRIAVEAALKQLSTATLAASSAIDRGTYDFRLLVQAGDAFTEELTRCAAQLETEFAGADARLSVINCVGISDDEVALRVDATAGEADGIGIICTNTSVITAALRRFVATGKPVVTLITDVDPDSRNTYIGVNNRAAGQAAAFLIAAAFAGA